MYKKKTHTNQAQTEVELLKFLEFPQRSPRYALVVESSNDIFLSTFPPLMIGFETGVEIKSEPPNPNEDPVLICSNGANELTEFGLIGTPLKVGDAVFLNGNERS